MRDPYEVLEVPKDASTEDVRKAYRRKAKSAHPDVGGTDQAMAELSRALTILEDPDKRAHFDACGETEDPSAENMRSAAIGIVVELVNAIIEQYVQGPGGDPEGVDMVKAMTSAINDRIKEMRAKKKKLDTHVAKAQKVADRFMPKKGKPPSIKIALEHNARLWRGRADSVGKDIEAHELAITLVRDNAFEFDAKMNRQNPDYRPAPQQQAVGFQQFVFR